MEENRLTESKMGKVIDWAYDKAINGLPGMESAYDLAREYMGKYTSTDESIDDFIRGQEAKCAASGFITGLGGVITLPVAIPANICSVIYMQVRMIATIAIINGYDLMDEEVRTLVYVCLTGQSAADILKQKGIRFGIKMANGVIDKIPSEVIMQINKVVGFKLVTKYGEKGVINLGKCVPIIGGIIGGTVDAVGTLSIGKTAKMIFS